MTKPRHAKQLTKDEILARWFAHVKATPSGHKPVYLGGMCFAWQIVWRKEEIERNFALWPREHWPKWVTELLPLVDTPPLREVT